MPKTNVPKINHELWAFGNFYVYSHYQIMHRSGSRHRGSICTYLSKPICRSVFSHVKPTKKEVNSLKLVFLFTFQSFKERLFRLSKHKSPVIWKSSTNYFILLSNTTSPHHVLCGWSSHSTAWTFQLPRRLGLRAHLTMFLGWVKPRTNWELASGYSSI